MYYYITCITILHVLLYYYRNRLKLYTEDINEHDTPQLEWVFIQSGLFSNTALDTSQLKCSKLAIVDSSS